MTFYVSRALDASPIRFGVTHRLADPTLDDPGRSRFSTGPRGEYLRFREGTLFYSDALGTAQPGKLVFASAARRKEPTVPLWGWVSIGFGALLILLGALVVVNKGYYSGYFEAAVGVALVVLPFVVGMEKRRRERQRREQERLAREAYEKQLRETAGAYIDRLNGLESGRDEAALAEIRKAREGKEIPYEHVSGAAKAAVLRAGFEALGRWDDLGGRGVAQVVSRVSDAVGLEDADRKNVSKALLQRAWWHLLVDDRMGPETSGGLEELRGALGIPPEEVERERRASEEFERLRGIGPRKLPRLDECPMKLRVLEHCMHVTQARLVTERGLVSKLRDRESDTWKEGPERDLIITNQRLMMREGKDLEIDVREIWDLEVDVDRGVLLIVEGGKRDYLLALPDPIYTAGLIQAAAEAPAKPKGLV